MVVFLILMYFLAGLTISCLYNALHSVPAPWDMTEDQKRMMFLIILAWPFMMAFWLVRETFKTVKWGINKLKK